MKQWIRKLQDSHEWTGWCEGPQIKGEGQLWHSVQLWQWEAKDKNSGCLAVVFEIKQNDQTQQKNTLVATRLGITWNCETIDSLCQMFIVFVMSGQSGCWQSDVRPLLSILDLRFVSCVCSQHFVLSNSKALTCCCCAHQLPDGCVLVILISWFTNSWDALSALLKFLSIGSTRTATLPVCHLWWLSFWLPVLRDQSCCC